MPPLVSPLRARVSWDLAAVCVALVVLPVAALRRVSDPSPWLHLKVGDWLLAGHRFSLPDPWAPYVSQAYVPTQWLPSVLTSAAYQHLGLAFVAWERVAGIAVLAAALLVWARSVARWWIAALVTAVAMYAAWPGLTERPQLLGFVLLVPVVAAWVRIAEDHRPRWWLVPLTWVAACVHGVWATGGGLAALLGLTVVLGKGATRRERAQLLGLLAACAVAGALTPIGPRLLLTPFTVGGQGRQFVREWQASSVRDPHVLAALLMLVATWLIWVWTRRRAHGWEIVLLIAACALDLTMQRTVPVGAIVAVPMLAAAVESVRSQTVRSQTRPARRPLGRSGGAAVASAVLVGLVIAAAAAPSMASGARGVPTGLDRQLAALPPGTHILVEGDTSGWLMEAHPDLAPVFDLRIESYSARHTKDFIATMRAERGWQDFISRTSAKAALIPDDSPLVASLSGQLQWTIQGSDAGMVLMEAP